MSYGKCGKAGCVTDGRITRIWIAGLNGFLATTCDDQIYIYDLQTLKICFITRYFPSKITNFDGCCKFLIASIGDKLYYTERLKINEISTSHSNPILGCIIISQLIISYSANKLLIINREDGDFIESHSIVLNNISHVIKLKGIENTLLICTDNSLLLFDVVNNKTSILTCLSGIKIISHSQSAQSGIIALLTPTSKLYIIDTLTDELFLTLQLKDITSLNFVEKSDNEYLVLSTSNSGILSILNLETRTVEFTFNTGIDNITQLEYCHNLGLLLCIGDNSIVSLIPNSSENFFKIEKFRKGHPSSITHIHHYGDEGIELLTCSQKDGRCYIGITSTIQQQQSVLFSSKSIKLDSGNILRPIKSICASYIRRFDWPNIITCHESTHRVHIWSGLARSYYDKCLELSDSRPHATSILLSNCGNHVIIGYKNGLLYKFNLQSSLSVGPFIDKNNTAHLSTIIGLFHGNDNTFSSICKYYEDQMIKIWDMKERKLLYTFNLEIPKSSYIEIANQQSNGFLSAYLTSENTILIVDLSLKSTFRSFTPSILGITNLCFHPNIKWLLYSGGKSLIIYDILVAMEIRSISFDDEINTFLPSPDGVYLYIAHSNITGTINIYTNDYKFEAVEGEVVEDEDYNILSEYKNLFSLSDANWGFVESILMHDKISKNNAPQSIEKPIKVPFFLPTEYKQGNLVFSHPKRIINKKGKFKNLDVNAGFISLLDSGESEKIFDYLKSQTPAAIHLLFSCEMQSEEIQKILNFFLSVAKSRENYDLCQVYLSIFIKYNVEALIDKNNKSLIDELRSILSNDWDLLRDEFEAISCYLKFFAHI